ncbi:MAG: hypothetical protein MJZ25_12625 [Fibrobacter sp.]|nr:hypothetical protein [Fibrobacter sp.]
MREVKLGKLMIVFITCCVAFLAEDAFAIRIPTKVVKRIFEGTEHTAGKHWNLGFGAARAGIRNIHRIDSLSRDSLRRNRYETFVADTHENLFLRVPTSLQDVIDSKVDSIQNSFQKANLDSVEENKSRDTLNIDHVNESISSKEASVNLQQEKSMFSNWSVEKWFGFFATIILLSVAIVGIYKYLPSEKDV